MVLDLDCLYLPSQWLSPQQELRMFRFTRHRIVILAACLVVVALAGCGAANETSSPSSAGSSAHAPSASFGQDTSGSAASTPGTATSVQYLSKTLNVQMTVTDTRKSADEIQNWVAATDPKSTSAGSSYEEISDKLYRVSLTFSVQATLYPQIAAYMRDYGEKHGGRLVSYNESVQDVTNDFVDAQSRLSNLRTEQQRLQALLSKAQNLSDTLQIEQRLTDVEGQIENIEAHLNQLSGQVTYYPVTVVLEPVATDTPVGPAEPWNPGNTLGSALSAALVFAEFLVNVLIWVVVFSVFLVPVVAAFVLWRRYRRAHPRSGRAAPAYATAVPPPPTMPGPPQE